MVVMHVNMFQYFKTIYIICVFFAKFIYNEYIKPYFLSHVVFTIFANTPPPFKVKFPFSSKQYVPINKDLVVLWGVRGQQRLSIWRILANWCWTLFTCS